jgi:hypothetical protein
MRKLHLLLYALVVIGCAKQDPNQVLYNEVMDIHDEVMPRMDDIMRLKRELNERIDKEELSDTVKTALENKILLLDSAGKAMMDWMHNFKPEDYTGEGQRTYLESEREHITKVKETMLNAIEKASTN